MNYFSNIIGKKEIKLINLIKDFFIIEDMDMEEAMDMEEVIEEVMEGIEEGMDIDIENILDLIIN